MAEDSATATLKQRTVNEEMSFGSPANGMLKKLIQKGCNDLEKKKDEQRPEGSEERKKGTDR